jgi:type I restriction enzyme M protein
LPCLDSFSRSPIPVCLWFITKNKKKGRFSNRDHRTLFIDARKLGFLIDRVHRELTDEEIERIASTYHAWRGENGTRTYKDLPGLCKSATLEEIRQHGYVLTPGRYVSAEELEDDSQPFEAKMRQLTARLEEQFAESHRLEQMIRVALSGVQDAS